VKSPPLEEGICSVFDFDKTYLFLDLWTSCLRIIVVPVPLILILICYATCLSC
jgi:hypothetical protein